MTNRRNFLKTTAACSAVALASPTLAQDDSGAKPWLRKTLKFHMIGVKGSIEEKFEAAVTAGFEGVEFSAPGIDVDAVNAAKKNTGIIVDGTVGGSHWKVRYTDPDPKVRAEALSRLKRAIEETAAVGGDTALVVAGKGEDGSKDEVYKRAIDTLSQALETAEKHKVKIVIENVWNQFLYDHDGDHTQTADAHAKFVDEFQSPWVAMQFDLGNHWKYGDIAQWVRTLDQRIVKLDIKGFSRKLNKFTKITEGDVDWPSIEKALRDIKFTGWLAAEVGGGGPERLQEISKNMDAALNCGAPVFV